MTIQTMLIYTTADGERIEGATPLDVVRNLRDTSRFEAATPLSQFMPSFAARCEQFYGQHPRDDTPEHFLADLIKLGFLSPA